MNATTISDIQRTLYKYKDNLKNKKQIMYKHSKWNVLNNDTNI